MNYDWPSFFEALRKHGPHLLIGLDEAERALVAMLAVDTDAFWSDGLQDLLAHGASAGDLRGGVLSTVEQWRENVLTVLADEYTIELDWSAVSVAGESPLIDELVQAASAAGA